MFEKNWIFFRRNILGNPKNVRKKQVLGNQKMFQHAMRPAPRILRRNPNGIEKIFKESDGAGNVYRIFVNSYDVM